MASLTQTAITTRKIVRYSIYFIIFLIVGRFLLGVGISIVNKIFPPKAPAPTILFNKLPALPFPNKGNGSNLTYTIQTPSGNLPTVNNSDNPWLEQAKVYYMPQSRSNLLALDNAKTKAVSFGFTNNPTQISSTIYKFASLSSSSSLEMNIITGTFSIGFDLNADPSPLSTQPPSGDGAAQKAKSFLSRASVLPDDLTGPVTQEYLKVQNRRLTTAISLSEANLTKINLFRKDYDKLPSLSPNPGEANVWFLMSGLQDQGKQIVGAQFYYYPIDETQFSTYPIKTSDQAFKDLQSGKGYIANLGNNSNGQITIRRVYLAYYDSGTATQFYQPIAVFEGDNGFVAYVPAVTSTYYSE